MADTTRASRITSYKNAGQGTTELRRKRVELSVALRKQARDEQLLKRRAMSPEAGDEETQPTEELPSVQEIVQGLKSNDLATMTSSARAARRMLSREQNPPISVMVQAGGVAPLVAALDRDDCADLQFEAAWALTNIASGSHDHTMAVVDGGAIPKLVLLLSRGGAVGEQSAWALGNIAGDGPETRDAVLARGALPALLPSLVPAAPRARLNTAVWTYSNLCRNKNPLVDFELVAPALPYISELLTIEDQDALADACWALSYLTDGPNDRIEAVQTTPGLLPRLVALLEHRSAAVKTPALRAVGNMLTGSDVQTDRCLDAGCLPPLLALLQCSKPSLVKEGAWAMSNVLAGTHAQIQRAIDGGALALLAALLDHADVKCQKEAAWAITNLCLGGAPAQLDRLFAVQFLEPYTRLLASPDHRAAAVVLDGLTHLLQLDRLFAVQFLEPYTRLLASPDHRAAAVVLDGLTHLLQAADRYGQVEALCIRLEEIGALDKIEALQHHENEQIYKKVVHIMDTYFAETEDQAAPEATDDQYQFAAPSGENIQF